MLCLMRLQMTTRSLSDVDWQLVAAALRALADGLDPPVRASGESPPLGPVIPDPEANGRAATILPAKAKRNMLRGKWAKGFASWWPNYPRRTAKGDALKAWLALMPEKEEGFRERYIAILVRLRELEATEWKGRELDLIPYPATFLRAEEFARDEE